MRCPFLKTETKKNSGNPVEGLEGGDCLKYSTSTYCFLIFNDILPAIFCFLCCLVGLSLLYVIYKHKRKLNLLLMTVIYATLGSAFLCATFSMAAVESQRTISIVIANGTKVDSYAPAGAALLVVSFFFITLSALNISLVWIETASAAKRLKMLSGNRIQAYKNFLFAYYVIFLTLLATFIATDHLVLADAVVIPAFLFIAVSYLYGWLLLRPLLNDSQLASDSKKKTEVLALIAQTALILSLFCAVLVGSAIVLALYGDKNTGSSPIAQPTVISGRQRGTPI